MKQTIYGLCNLGNTSRLQLPCSVADRIPHFSDTVSQKVSRDLTSSGSSNFSKHAAQYDLGQLGWLQHTNFNELASPPSAHNPHTSSDRSSGNINPPFLSCATLRSIIVATHCLQQCAIFPWPFYMVYTWEIACYVKVNEHKVLTFRTKGCVIKSTTDSDLSQTIQHRLISLVARYPLSTWLHKPLANTVGMESMLGYLRFESPVQLSHRQQLLHIRQAQRMRPWFTLEYRILKTFRKQVEQRTWSFCWSGQPIIFFPLNKV